MYGQQISSHIWTILEKEIKIAIPTNKEKNVKDEEVYIRSFRELVGFEESVKRDEGSFSEYEDQWTAQARKRARSAAINELNVAKLTDTISLHSIETANLTYDDRFRPNFKGQFQDRMIRRAEMINLLLKSLKNGDDSYTSCLEMFIDLEEEKMAFSERKKTL